MKQLKQFVLVLLACLLASTVNAENQAAPKPNSVQNTVKYWVEDPPNPDIKIFHLTKRVSYGVRPSITRNLTPLQADLLDVEGVTEANLDNYSVSIVKGSAFNWGEITPKVTNVLEKSLGKLEQRVPEGRRKIEETPPPKKKTGQIN